MKTTHYLGIALAAIIALFAASCTEVNSHSNPTQHYKKIYDKAIQYNDFQVANMALFELIETETPGIDYRDTLLLTYYDARNYASVLLLGRKLVEEDKSLERLVMTSVAAERLGLLPEALKYYNQLYEFSGNPEYLYQQATIHYNLRQSSATSIKDAEDLVSRLVEDVAADTVNINITFGENDQEKQIVPLKAAAWNLMGFIQLFKESTKPENQRVYTEAEKAFSNAVQVYPEFKLAKNNLSSLKQLSGN